MAILNSSSGQVEVRLVKPPFDTGELIFFDEYAKLVRETGSNECERIIVPESTTYAIQITVKKGFQFDKCYGYKVSVYDIATGQMIVGMPFAKGTNGPNLLEDQVFLITKTGPVVIDGQVREEMEFFLRQLSPDLEGDTTCDQQLSLGGLRIKFCKIAGISNQKKDGAKYKKELELHLAAKESLVEASKDSKKIDILTYDKEGVTHEISLNGGYVKDRPHKYFGVTEGDTDHMKFTFYFRNSNFFEKKGIIKTPIPLDRFPYDQLTTRESASCFKLLQTYDKEHTLKQKIAEAGLDANADEVEYELFESADVPNRWRAFSHVYKREREKLFNELQTRRSYFEKGKYPPDEHLSSNLKNPVLGLHKDPAKKEPAESSNSAQGTQQAKISQPAEVPKLRNTFTIKSEPSETSTSSTKKTKLPIIITLDDSDDEIPKNPPSWGTKRPHPLAVTTIKAEPIHLDIEASPVPPEAYASKKIKLEPNAQAEPEIEAKKEGSIDPASIKDDAELLRLKEEDERIEEELLAAQRVADLMRERNEKRRIIAALEARKNPAPSRGENPRR